jgi:PncC family amidohydrolase|tara:strand:+ start:236 stop:700 length:465 start_codon:yes stop_codon:yes gene_type:complete
MYSYNIIIRKILSKNISISIAESCTGGLLSSKFTSVAGISKIFNLGLIPYSNKSKSSLLKISQNDLKKYGSVSHQTASLMVKNLHQLTKSKLCISTTGIAGPSGGTRTKPVGLIYFGIKYRNKTIISEKKFYGSRLQVQQKTVKAIFTTLEKLI